MSGTKDQRRHRRIKLHIMEINGRMSLADKVEIIDISLGGVALKADRRLNIGKEYAVKLGDQGHLIEVKGVVVRSALSGIEQKPGGDQVSVYTAGLRFLEGAAERVATFLKTMACTQKVAVPAINDRRDSVRFQILVPGEKVLSFPTQFRVCEISLCGILIRCEHTLTLESMIPMELSLSAENTVRFKGRVAYCKDVTEGDHPVHEIGVEFFDLSVDDRALLSQFIDYLIAAEVQPGGVDP